MTQVLILIVALILGIFLNSTVFAQTAEQKTQNLIASLDKTKYKKKEKKDVSFEFYLNIKNEAVVKNNAREYAGVYGASDSTHRIELRIAPNGELQGGGYDSRFDQTQKRSFTFKNARIEGALLTATKVYENGESKNFEAVFINRTLFSGKNANEITEQETKYGLGFIDHFDSADSSYTSRIFLEPR